MLAEVIAAVRYEAACDLVRATDDLRELRAVGWATPTDRDRVKLAAERWERLRRAVRSDG